MWETTQTTKKILSVNHICDTELTNLNAYLEKKNTKKNILKVDICLAMKNFGCKYALDNIDKKRLGAYHFSKRFVRERLNVEYYFKMLSQFDHIKFFLLLPLPV